MRWITFILITILLYGCSATPPKVSPADRQYDAKASIPQDTPEPSEVIAMQIFSPAFGHNQMIPTRYTCIGEDISPPLKVQGIPAGTKTLALIMDDPDAPVGTWDHWLTFNIPPRESIPEAVEDLGVRGTNSWGNLGYGGPCPPSGTHRYFFKLYALDVELLLSEGADKGEIEEAMEGHILAQAELVGKFSKG